MKQEGWRLSVKRAIDIAAASTGLVIGAPVIAIVALGVRYNLGTPVLFCQERPGLGGRLFKFYKFRTMRDARGPDGLSLPDEERMTKFGQFLRASSLDELPQLYNVLKGELSLVGPRPLLVEYLGRYSSEQARRHDVLPGITGWAQINGRNSISWPEKFALDVWYVDNWSLWLDVAILFKTAKKVLYRDGISSTGHVTMPVFMGNE